MAGKFYTEYVTGKMKAKLIKGHIELPLLRAKPYRLQIKAILDKQNVPTDWRRRNEALLLIPVISEETDYAECDLLQRLAPRPQR